MSLGSRINEIRREKKLSIDDLCIKSGIPKGTLSKITAGITTSPTLDTVKAIAAALECRLDDLDDTPKRESLSSSEQAHIKKYRSLDPYGQEAVDDVLDVEWRRCEEDRQAKAAAVREERERTSRESAKQMPTLVPEGGLEDSARFFMSYVKRLDPVRQQAVVDQYQKALKELQREPLSSSNLEEVDDRVLVAEPLDQSQ